MVCKYGKVVIFKENETIHRAFDFLQTLRSLSSHFLVHQSELNENRVKFFSITSLILPLTKSRH